jgi:hypothetical protein
MRDDPYVDPYFDPPESSTALVVGTAILAAFTLAVALYWPDEQLRADQKYARQSDAEHTKACVTLGFELRTPGFGKCIDELVKLQLRHQELLNDRVASASLL